MLIFNSDGHHRNVKETQSKTLLSMGEKAESGCYSDYDMWNILLLPFVVKYLVAPQLWDNDLKDEKFTGSDKCPACFGTSLCEEFMDGNLRLVSYSKFRFFDFVNIKNVYEGIYNYENVVLKRLGHNTEFETFDRDICKNAKLQPDCDVSMAIPASHLGKLNDKDGLTPQDVTGLSDLVRCPSQRLLDRIWNIYEAEKPVDGILSAENKIMLMVILAFNPEPLTTQVFSQSNGWPFPKFIGSCGRFVVLENVGKSLFYYYSEPWQIRVDFAYQAFAIAEKFTNNEEDFALYMTDVTYENFAVNAKDELMMVDVENVIVVDKKQINQDKPPRWDEKLQSVHDDCIDKHNCLSFSPNDLCSRVEADHNYYAVCHGILWTEASIPGKPNGLLHDIPEYVKESAELVKLLEECQNPSLQYGRFSTAPQLLFLLQKLAKRI
uniref:Deleted in autism protein 1 homolog n=1 Tax=Saccoglossus kowalevskii TaxID=10224 RepID=A0ABM0GTP9_SACKO|nr:PREDICTED: deleted in autism protein 1 homolog [Saccoglossus kowalevskii]